MNLKSFLRRSVAAVATVCAFGASQATVIFVAGTDAMSFHNDSSFNNPVLLTLQGVSTLPVLVIGGTAFTNTSGVATVDGGSTLGAAPLTSAYSAIIFQSPCCSDPAFRLAGFAADVDAFVDAGGGIFIEDYQGDAVWDSILNISVTTAAAKVVDNLICFDPGTSTAAGIAFGFSASYTNGCFVHQTYDNAYWTGEGFFALQTGDGGKFVTMAKGFAEPGKIPEPASIALVGLALLGLGASRRARRS